MIETVPIEASKDIWYEAVIVPKQSCEELIHIFQFLYNGWSAQISLPKMLENHNFECLKQIDIV